MGTNTRIWNNIRTLWIFKLSNLIIITLKKYVLKTGLELNIINRYSTQNGNSPRKDFRNNNYYTHPAATATACGSILPPSLDANAPHLWPSRAPPGSDRKYAPSTGTCGSDQISSDCEISPVYGHTRGHVLPFHYQPRSPVITSGSVYLSLTI